MKSQLYLFIVFIFFWLFGALALNAFEVTFVGKTIEMPQGTEQTAYLTLLGDPTLSEEISISIEPISSAPDLRRWVYLEKDNLRLAAGYQHRMLIFIKPPKTLAPGLYQAWIKVESLTKLNKRTVRIPLAVQLL
jgi:hypothetical protein